VQQEGYGTGLIYKENMRTVIILEEVKTDIPEIQHKLRYLIILIKGYGEMLDLYPDSNLKFFVF
jgi:hypothetical protein